MIKIHINENGYIVNCETGEIYTQDEIEQFISDDINIATFDTFEDYLVELEKINHE
jgi:hypothetical protein